MIDRIMECVGAYNAATKIGREIDVLLTEKMGVQWYACVHPHYVTFSKLSVYPATENRAPISVKISSDGWKIVDVGFHAESVVDISSILESVFGQKEKKD